MAKIKQAYQHQGLDEQLSQLDELIFNFENEKAKALIVELMDKK